MFPRPTAFNLAALAARVAPLGEARATAHLLRATLDGLQLIRFPDDRAIVHGTDDETTARSFYSLLGRATWSLEVHDDSAGSADSAARRMSC